MAQAKGVALKINAYAMMLWKELSNNLQISLSDNEV